jgi:hypothetical protein
MHFTLAPMALRLRTVLRMMSPATALAATSGAPSGVVHDESLRPSRRLHVSYSTGARSGPTDAAVMHDTRSVHIDGCRRHARHARASASTAALVVEDTLARRRRWFTCHPRQERSFTSTHPSVVNDRCIGADGQTRRSSTTGALVYVRDAPRREPQPGPSSTTAAFVIPNMPGRRSLSVAPFGTTVARLRHDRLDGRRLEALELEALERAAAR